MAYIRWYTFPFLLTVGPCYHIMLSTSPHDQVDTTTSVDDATDLTDLQGERRIFEGLLHRPAAEPPEFSSMLVGRAIRVTRRKLSELLSRTVDFFLILLKNRDGFIFSARDCFLGGILNQPSQTTRKGRSRAPLSSSKASYSLRVSPEGG
jgi:hypothetical protein